MSSTVVSSHSIESHVVFHLYARERKKGMKSYEKCVSNTNQRMQTYQSNHKHSFEIGILYHILAGSQFTMIRCSTVFDHSVCGNRKQLISSATVSHSWISLFVFQFSYWPTIHRTLHCTICAPAQCTTFYLNPWNHKDNNNKWGQHLFDKMYTTHFVCMSMILRQRKSAFVADILCLCVCTW